METARRLLGPDKIIGLSVTNPEQARAAAETSCDYIGLGPLYATATKKDHAPPLGLDGARKLIDSLPALFKRPMPVVAIGGINPSNISSVMSHVQPAGCAIVSAIMSAPDAQSTCLSLRSTIHTHLTDPPAAHASTASEVAAVFQRVHMQKPLVHHITNNVVKDFSANVCLALGGSPIMSEDVAEADDLAAINGALVLNMGTAGANARELYSAVIERNNTHGVPVIFDPVGAGATHLRRAMSAAVLEMGRIDVIKGNEGEIRTLVGEAVRMKGVDSSSPGGGSGDRYTLVLNLAEKLQNIVVMTGVKDIVSDGTSVWELDDGSEFQGLITGTGCSLGTAIGVAVAAAGKDKAERVSAVLAAVMLYNAAARWAGRVDEETAPGPGTWKVQFIDALWQLARATEEEGGGDVLKKALRRGGAEVEAKLVMGPELEK